MVIDRFKRDRRLKAIGFKSYKEYLASDLWKGIREEVFAIKGRVCLCCNSPATQLHHTRYKMEELLGTNLRHIQPVCGPCHKQIEFDENGHKRSRCRVGYEYKIRSRKKRSSEA